MDNIQALREESQRQSKAVQTMLSLLSHDAYSNMLCKGEAASGRTRFVRPIEEFDSNVIILSMEDMNDEIQGGN